ncbi:hypothetical protein Runsl_1292 [Runella slithyformis DSM 19594]|uniref:DUF4249 domain-containing protein n=2 Tax=Runella TaxID=105 RepID=A0A7U3ZIA0_RUNSL|nr:hypothetical protein Runsl_1292 [Runella slithyformis DSM 19594]
MQVPMRFNLKLSGILLPIAVFIWGCVDLYKVDIQTAKSYLIVEGSITDLPERQFISLFRTKANTIFKSSDFTSTIVAQKNSYDPVKAAKVKIVENGTISYSLTEETPGFYVMPFTFLGKAGNTYQLFIETPEGQKYRSAIETMAKVPPIERIYEKFNAKGILDRSTSIGNIATNDFYVDFSDPVNERNFYRWSSITYESQKISATCRGGLYYKDAGSLAECRTDNRLSVNNLFDYEAETLCWDIFYGNTLNIFSDVYTNGKTQKDKLVAQIPLYQSNPCLVVIRQSSLSPNAYRYLKLVQDQSLNTGTLADTPPAPIKGNVVNEDDKAELVLGYFMAGMVNENRYWLDRKNTSGGQPDGLFFIKNGREPNLEPPFLYRLSVPKAICVNSENRTSNSPSGWRF